MSDPYPNLEGFATSDLVEKIGTGSYSASYINWARTMHLLRTNAPGWMPELVPAPDGSVVHRAPTGGFLLIRFVNKDGEFTPAVPQAIMDNRNQSVPWEKISARDVTDTHRRGVCLAAAFTFGLAYELWAKMPLESGYADAPEPPVLTEQQAQTIAALIGSLAKLRSVPEDEVRKAVEHDAKAPLTELSEDAAAALIGKMQRWQRNLEAAASSGGGAVSPSATVEPPTAPGTPPETLSAGEPAAGTDGVGDRKLSESVDDAPAEPLFQAPTGPRGSKAKGKAA